MNKTKNRAGIRLFLFLTIMSLLSIELSAAPIFARQYNISCTTCHSAFPKLNDFGKEFMANNFRLPNWKESTVSGGDDQLALPSSVPIAFRVQGYLQSRDSQAVDVTTGDTTETNVDFQAPYLIKMISSAPLSDSISYYFYAIYAEKGGNGEVIVEDAWISHDDIFGSDVSMILGQFQVSDLMFPRETRLTFQDYMAFRMAGITYERGAIFEKDIGPLSVGVGAINGNGISDNITINSPGYKRPDHMFDNNNDKAMFGRVGLDLNAVSGGLFYYKGSQKDVSGARDTDKQVAGLDLSGDIGGDITWFGQALWNEWDGFIDQNKKYSWIGGFFGVDYIPEGKWSYSLLYNYADGSEFDNTDTVYEGIDINSLTLNASYYFMRNVKGVIEANTDFLTKEQQSGTLYTGHLSKENYLILGFDAAF